MFEILSSRDLRSPPQEPGYPQPPYAAEPVIDGRAILASLRRHWWVPVLTTIAGLGIGYLLVARQTPAYRASATIRLIDPRSSYADIIGDGGGGKADPVASQLVVLQGRAYLGAVVDRASLRLVADSPSVFDGDPGIRIEAAESAAMRLRVERRPDGVRLQTAGHVVSGAYDEPITVGDVRATVAAASGPAVATYYVIGRDEAVDRLAAAMRTAVRSGTDAIDISHTSTDPTLSPRVVNAAVGAFRDVNAESMRQSAVRRRVFVGEQLRRADSMLVAAQTSLSEVRRDRAVYSSGTRMRERQTELAELDRQRQTLEADRTIYDLLLGRLTAGATAVAGPQMQAILVSPAIAANPLVTSIANQLQVASAVRDSLTSVSSMTAINPQVLQADTMRRLLQDRLAEAVRGHLGSMEIRLDALKAVRERILTDLRAMPEADAQETRLIEEVEAARNAATELRSELQRARIAEAVEAGQVEVVSLAAGALPMGSPILLRFVLAGMAGLLFGCGLTLLMEQMNRSIRKRDELEGALRLRKLAVIPYVPTARDGIALKREVLRLEAEASPSSDGIPPDAGHRWSSPPDGGERWRPTPYSTDSMAAEAFRTLRTNLLFGNESRDIHTLVVTSATPGEGKTTVAVNLAIAMAQLGMRVLLIDADLRQPRVHELVHLDAEPGLTDLFAIHGKSADSVVQRTRIHGLDVLACGPPIPNPAELLSGGRMEAILDRLGREYDRVVIDSPPVLGASETSALGARADGTLLVVRAGQTDRDAAREALYQLETVGATILGGVLNDPREIVSHYGSQAYRYYAEH